MNNDNGLGLIDLTGRPKHAQEWTLKAHFELGGIKSLVFVDGH
jgi:hypothetical protein